MKYVDQSGALLADYPDYLRDESRVAASTAEAIAWPESEADVIAALGRAREHGWPVTVSAARTGIVAAAVPLCGGMIISTERFNAITGFAFDEPSGEWRLIAQPGVLISSIEEALDSVFAQHGDALSPAARAAAASAAQQGIHLFYPPDPTETTATLGGTVATNASGARTFRYGATRAWVSRIRVVLADGAVLNIPRSFVSARGGTKINIPGECFVTKPIRKYEISVPAYSMPDTKHCAGYYGASETDLIDLFIGSEGTLGIITEIEVALRARTHERLSVTAFFGSEDDAFRFVQAIREAIAARTLDAEAIEYFGRTALELLRTRRAEGDWQIAAIPDAAAAVYLELAFPSEAMDAVFELLDQHLRCCNSSTESAWAGTEEAEIQKMKTVRHAVPEIINQIIGERKRSVPSLHKIATDLAVPDNQFDALMRFYHEELDNAGLEHVIFGHIGNNHLHVNMLPRTEAELGKAKELYRLFAGKAIEFGGTVAAEHGIGRLKKEFLAMLYGTEGIDQMRAVKRALDPDMILGRGVLFEP